MNYSRKNPSAATQDFNLNNKPSESGLTTRLRELMFKRRISARELALRAGLGQSFVYDILNGRSKNPTTGKISKIAKVLGVDVSYLTDGRRQLETGDLAVINFATDPENSLIFDKKFISEVKGLDADNLCIFEITDDRMSPTLNFGEKVIADTSRVEPVNNKLYLFNDGVNFIARRLILIENKFYLKTDNAGIIGETVLLDDINIVGKIVLHSRAC